MNKSFIAVITSIVILAAVGSAVVINSDNKANNESAQSSDDSQMEKTIDDAMENENEAIVDGNNDAMEKTEDDSSMMKKTETYVTLADYNSDKSTYADSTKVLFFHASWCSICQGIEKEINADSSRIPEGTTFIKTDFDSETDLRKKYGVTTQYTFVQVDNDGNQIKKWSATSLDKAVAGIQS